MSRLYLIDDHAIVRDGLRAVLEAAGHVVVGEAAGPTPALADLARLQPEIVLLDLRLGERSGFELLAELQRRQWPLRVIVLTMSDQPRHVSEALRYGAWGYLLKGASSSELLQAVLAVSQQRRYLCPR
jgi:two-component system, NarL family, invasion response regulator UvrY